MRKEVGKLQENNFSIPIRPIMGGRKNVSYTISEIYNIYKDNIGNIMKSGKRLIVIKNVYMENDAITVESYEKNEEDK